MSATVYSAFVVVIVIVACVFGHGKNQAFAGQADFVSDRAIKSRLNIILEQEFRRLNSQRPVFNENISDVVSPLIKRGESFAEVEDYLKSQNMSSLQKYKGEERSECSTYGSSINLVNNVTTNVFAIIFVCFTRSSGGEIVDHVDAYIRSVSL